jgi:hypothetical protein
MQALKFKQFYYIDGANDETFSSITTTNASGQATITYPSLAAYEAALIEPPASDQINALTYVRSNCPLTNPQLLTFR